MADVRPGEGSFPEDYTYERVSAADFAETLAVVRAVIEQRGLVIRRSYDIKAALAAKGFPIQPLTILEVGRSEEEGITDLLGLLTPLRVNVYQRGKNVFVSALKPSFVTRLVSDDEVEELADRLEGDVVAIVDAVGVA